MIMLHVPKNGLVKSEAANQNLWFGFRTKYRKVVSCHVFMVCGIYVPCKKEKSD